MKKKVSPETEDTYLAIIDEHWDNIAGMYELFKDRKPIIEYDISDHKIYSYPASDYINNLSSRIRDDTMKDYRAAIKKKQFMLFVRDTKRQRFRSYIYDLPDFS